MTTLTENLEALGAVDQQLKVNRASSLILARRDFSEFLKHVKILEPPPGGAIIPFQVWPHLKEANETILSHTLIVWMKARQIGATWDLAALALFVAMYQKGAYVPLFSQGLPEAQKFLAKCRFIWSELTPELQVPLGTDSKTELSFPSMLNSSIEALPSTQKAGRSTAPTLAIMDEADHHEYLEANYFSLKPGIDSSGGRLILVSTPNLDNQVSLFKTLYRNAPENGFTAIYFPWSVRPGRDEEWYQQKAKEYPDQERFQKEYSSSANEALSPPSTLSFIDVTVLGAMEMDNREPIESLWGGMGHVWQKWYTGKRYVAFTDTSHGVGADDAVSVVMDVGTGYIVADLQSSLLGPAELALKSIELLGRYGNPLWAIEDNDWGRVTIEKARELGYPHLYYRGEGQAGFHTNEGNRMNVWVGLKEGCQQRLITVPSRQGLSQFYNVIKNPKKEGRVEAQAGGKDDYPWSVAGAWNLRHRAFVTQGAARTDPRVLAGFHDRSRRPGLRW